MDLVIIGNGIAGITAARHVRKLDPEARITVVSDESDHAYARTALMYLYMGHLQFAHTKLYEDRFWETNRIGLLRDRVLAVDTDARTLTLRDGGSLSYDRLLIATGSVPRFAGWPGQDLDGVQGFYDLQDLDRMEVGTEGITDAVVVGGGLIGVEVAEMLHTRGIHVTLLVRGGWYLPAALPREEGLMVAEHIRAHGIDLRLDTELAEALPDATGRVRAVRTNRGEEIAAQWLGIAIGVAPNVAFLDGSGLEIDRGVLVDEAMRTNVPGVFAAGDCAQHRTPPPGRPPIEPLWYAGREQGATAAFGLCDRPRSYAPGVFFNSAKFFDIEWQVYGDISPVLPDGHGTLLWQHPTEPKAIRLEYAGAPASGDGAAPPATRLVGVNVMGVRYRQDVCAHWIETGASIEVVLQNLGAANFDPEFSPQYEADLVAQYNAQTGRSLALQRRRGWRERLAVLAR
jgi:NADPH-dependent 2,4-dienoyl-CoA reductase/sulfur reductase-like enzyme